MHFFLYECITYKVKPCLSNYCTFHMLPQMNTTNTKYCNIHEKNIFLVDILSLLLVRSKIFINITSDVFHCHAPGKNLLECCTHLLWCPHMQHSWIPTETSDLVVYDHIHLHAEKKTILLDLRMESMVQVLHSQKMVVIVMWAIYIYMLPNLTG